MWVSSYESQYLVIGSIKTRRKQWCAPTILVSIKEIDRSANRLIFGVELCDGTQTMWD
jgi:hypothetical protein